jgi:hypothetical protein
MILSQPGVFALIPDLNAMCLAEKQQIPKDVVSLKEMSGCVEVRSVFIGISFYLVIYLKII